jgi:cysteine desulfurase
VIYLDHASTTPLDPRVRAAMEPYLSCGNASSLHAEGRAARKAVEDARDRVAAALRADPKEIIFTSGATEADNLAILGMARGKHVIVSAVEHPAVLEPARRHCDASIAPVDGRGRLLPIDTLIRRDTALISVMRANNEVGTLQPVEELSGAPIHTDAAQACGPMGRADLMTISGHKLYGPKGVGALVVRRGTKLEPQVFGGGHEFERRAGTENVAAIVGLAAALELPRVDVAPKRDRLEARLREIPRVRFNGDLERRLPGITNVGFEGIDGEALVIALDAAGVCAATGSACASGASEPSHVLTAMGLDRRAVAGSIRLSLGRTTTDADVDTAAVDIRRAVERLRALSPVWRE